LNAAIDFRRSISVRDDLMSATHLSHTGRETKSGRWGYDGEGKEKKTKEEEVLLSARDDGAAACKRNDLNAPVITLFADNCALIDEN